MADIDRLIKNRENNFFCVQKTFEVVDLFLSPLSLGQSFVESFLSLKNDERILGK